MDSGSMPLSKFISEYKDHLPQAIEVTVGKEDTVQGGISSGEILIACFLKSTRVVKTHLHRLNCAVSLPINSKLRFALLPDNCKPLDPSKSYPWECEVNSVAQLLKMDCLPKAVKVMKQCQSHASKVLSKKHVVSSGTILLNLKKTTIRSGLGMKNGIKCTSGHGVVHFFTETDQVSFHTYRQSVHMPVYEFFEHMRYPVTGEVHLVSEVNESISLQTGDRVTFLCAEEETMLVLKNHHTDLPEVPICSVPCDLDIEVKCVSLESEGNVYEDIKECKKMIRNASNTHIGVPEPGLHSYVDMNVLGVASRELRRFETPCPRNMVKHLVKCYENKGSDPDPVKRFKKISIKSQSLELLPTTYENVEGGGGGSDSDTDYEEMIFDPEPPADIPQDTPIMKNLSQLRSLSVQKVSDLLKHLHLDEHVARFKQENIDGDLLADMDEDCLKDAGVVKSLHRLKLKKFITGEKAVPPNIA